MRPRSATVPRSVTRCRAPRCSCKRTTRSPLPSSASFTASSSTPRPDSRTTGSAPASSEPSVATADPSGDETEWTVEALRLGDHGVEITVVRHHGERDAMGAVIGGGVGKLGSSGEADGDRAVVNAVAESTVVEHRCSELRLGDRHEPVGAHFELGCVPRRRPVRRSRSQRRTGRRRSPTPTARRMGTPSSTGAGRAASRARCRCRAGGSPPQAGT